MSVPQSNSTQTIEIPIPDAERTRRTPVAPFIAASIGNVTSDSTSSGASPCASVTTVTVGAVRSGNTSTGMRSAVNVPYTVKAQAATRTKRRRSTDQRMTRSRRFMTAVGQWAWPWAGTAPAADASLIS